MPVTPCPEAKQNPRASGFSNRPCLQSPSGEHSCRRASAADFWPPLRPFHPPHPLDFWCQYRSRFTKTQHFLLTRKLMSPLIVVDLHWIIKHKNLRGFPRQSYTPCQHDSSSSLVTTLMISLAWGLGALQGCRYRMWSYLERSFNILQWQSPGAQCQQGKGP